MDECRELNEALERSRNTRGRVRPPADIKRIETAKLAGIMPADYLHRALDDALHDRPIPLPHQLVASA